MKRLELATNLALPIDACTQTFAWIGRKGSGKTYGSGKMVEELLENGIQTVILDTVGNWYGLRLSADGKQPAFDIPVFGGLRQDLPLLPTAGDVVADVVIDTGRSVILDVSQFNFSDRKRFAAGFGERLWQRKKGESTPAPLHLVIEECQLIVPQFVGKDDTRMVHVYEEIIRLGRNYGIGVSMITQRPQSVNKEVLTQTECLVVFQVNGVPERKALKEWITHEGADVNLLNDLPHLTVGSAWLWSPQWLRKFEKIHIAKKSTFDASATPKAGQSVQRRNPAPLDVDDIQERMKSTIEKVKADDPRALRAEIIRLKGELARKPAPVPAGKVKEVPALKDGDFKRIEKLIEKAAALEDKFKYLSVAIGAEGSRLSSAIASAASMRTHAHTSIRVPTHPDPSRATDPMDWGRKFEAAGRSEKTPVKRDPESRGEERGCAYILATVDMLNRRGIPATRESVARWLRLHPNGGRFNRNLATLRANCALDGFVMSTNLPTDIRPLDTGPTALLNALPDDGHRRVMQAIFEAEKPMSREELAARLGVHPNGGRFNRTLAWLRDMGVIPDRGAIMPTDGALK